MKLKSVNMACWCYCSCQGVSQRPTASAALQNCNKLAIISLCLLVTTLLQHTEAVHCLQTFLYTLTVLKLYRLLFSSVPLAEHLDIASGNAVGH